MMFADKSIRVGRELRTCTDHALSLGVEGAETPAPPPLQRASLGVQGHPGVRFVAGLMVISYKIFLYIVERLVVKGPD